MDIHKLAEQTPGFAGADIANVCNEAALIAARKGKEAVDMSDFQDAIDRVIGGLEKKNKIILPEEKEIIAYHEAGHAICGWFLEHAYPLLKVTIVPRGTAALGYAQYTPKEQYLYNTDQLNDQICMTLGGRAAETIFFNKISTGASNDLQQITKMAYSMVTVYGMNDKVGNVSYYDPSQENTFQKPFSEETGKMIDEEVRKLIEIAFERTKALLTEKKAEVEILAKELLKREVLFQSDVEALIGKRPFEEKKALDFIDNPKEAVVDSPIHVVDSNTTKLKMKVSSSKEKILKKIREALSNPVPLPFPKSEGNTPVFQPQTEDLEVLFAKEFTKLSGKFAFCLGEADLKNQLKNLIAQKKWEHVYCVEPHLSKIVAEDGFPKINQTTLANCDVSITGCEYLIARTGAIVMTTKQQSGRTVSAYAPVHICIAYVNQLVFETRDALKAIKGKVWKQSSFFHHICRRPKPYRRYRKNTGCWCSRTKGSLFIFG